MRGGRWILGGNDGSEGGLHSLQDICTRYRNKANTFTFMCFYINKKRKKSANE